MTEYPYIPFNKSPDQMRHLGARGGRAYGRNQRARRALLATTSGSRVVVKWRIDSYFDSIDIRTVGSKDQNCDKEPRTCEI